ncbi:MAG: hypothetical protein NW237_05095 [Cyanobacteriota bacterium]|nr:hypothetical protein [Cyanobacteriota bacterium]
MVQWILMLTVLLLGLVLWNRQEHWHRVWGQSSTQQLEQAVQAQNWPEAITIVEQMIRSQPQRRAELEAYREQLKGLQTQAEQAQSPTLLFRPFLLEGVDPTPAPIRPPQVGYDITLRFLDERFGPQEQAVIQGAARRWEEVVIGDLPEYRGGIGPARCARFIRQGTPAYPDSIDDVLVDVLVSDETDLGKKVGRTGDFAARALACVQRGEQGIYGVIQYELEFLEAASEGSLYRVSLHEFGHILGLVPSTAHWIRRLNSAQPTYAGAKGMREYQALGGRGQVPVQSCFPRGLGGGRDCTGAHSHWDPLRLPGEVMSTGAAISRVSLGVLMDLGYQVNGEAADPFVLGPG